MSNKSYVNQKVSSAGDSWIVCRSKSYSGQIYYFNTLTGESVWNLSHDEVEKAKNKTKNLGNEQSSTQMFPEPQEPPVPPVNHIKNNSHSEPVEPNQEPRVYNKQVINNRFMEAPYQFPTFIPQVIPAGSLNAPAFNPAVWAVPPVPVPQIYIAPALPFVNQAQPSPNVSYNVHDHNATMHTQPPKRFRRGSNRESGVSKIQRNPYPQRLNRNTRKKQNNNIMNKCIDLRDLLCAKLRNIQNNNESRSNGFNNRISESDEYVDNALLKKEYKARSPERMLFRSPPKRIGVDTQLARSPERNLHRSPERKIHRSPERNLHRSPERNLHRSPERNLHRSPGRNLHRSPERNLHRSPGRNLHRSPERKIHRSPERNLHRSPERNLHRSPGRNLHRSPERKIHRSPERNLHRSPERNLHRSPGRNLHRSPERNLHRSPERKIHRSPERNLHRSPERNLHRSPERNLHRSPERWPTVNTEERPAGSLEPSPPVETSDHMDGGHGYSGYCSDADTDWLEDNITVNGTKLALDISSLKKLADPTLISDCWYIVVDTNILLRHLHFLNVLQNSDEKCRLMFPRDVIQDLRRKSELSATKQRIAKRASRALKFVTQHLNAGSAIIGDRSSDGINEGFPYLLDCCLTIADQNYHVVLLTNNEDLQKYKPDTDICVFSIPQLKEFLSTNSQETSHINLEDKLSVSENLRSDNTVFQDKSNTTFGPIETNTVISECSELPKPTTSAVESNSNTNIINVKNNNNNSEGKSQNPDNIPTKKIRLNRSASNNSANSNKSTNIQLTRTALTTPAPPSAKVNGKQFKWRRRRVTPSARNVSDISSSNHSQNTDATEHTPACTATTSEENIPLDAVTEGSETTSSLIIPRTSNEKIIIDETSTSGIISNTPSNSDSYTDLAVTNRNIDSDPTSNNEESVKEVKTDRKHLMFEVTDSFMEENLKTRHDEWLSRYVQIMEEVLTQVLQQHTDFLKKLMPPPWNLQEATECIQIKYSYHKHISESAKTLWNFLRKITNSRGAVNVELSPVQFMEMYSYGVHLISTLKSVLNINDDLLTAAQSLAKLLDDVRNPNADASHNENFAENTYEAIENDYYIEKVVVGGQITLEKEDEEKQSRKTKRKRSIDTGGSDKLSANSEKRARRSEKKSSTDEINSNSKLISSQEIIQSLDNLISIPENVSSPRKVINSPDEIINSPDKVNSQETGIRSQEARCTDDVTNTPEEPTEKRSYGLRSKERNGKQKTANFFEKSVTDLPSTKSSPRFKCTKKLTFSGSTSPDKEISDINVSTEDNTRQNDTNLDIMANSIISTELEDKLLKNVSPANSDQFSYSADIDDELDAIEQDDCSIDKENFENNPPYEQFIENNTIQDEKEHDSNICTNNNYYSWVLKKLIVEIRDGLMEVNLFCVNSNKVLNDPQKLHECGQRQDIRNKAEKAHLCVQNLYNKLNSIFCRETNEENRLLSQLRDAGVCLDVGDKYLKGYREIVAKFMDQATILLESVGIIISLVKG